MTNLRFKDITVPTSENLPHSTQYTYRDCAEGDPNVLRFWVEDAQQTMYALVGPEVLVISENRKELVRIIHEMTGDEQSAFIPCVEESFGGEYSIRLAMIRHVSSDFNIIYHMFKTVYKDDQ